MRRLTTDDYAVDAVTMAKALVGAWLCRRLDDGTVIRRRITETEAYCGEEDTACHAHTQVAHGADECDVRFQTRPKPQVALYA
jgi:3-methyladenine DNA glycosylase Mpg